MRPADAFAKPPIVKLSAVSVDDLEDVFTAVLLTPTCQVFLFDSWGGLRYNL